MRPRRNQPAGFRGTGGNAPTYYYGRNHDYIFFPLAWTDEATGTSYESGYYDENGQYYPSVSFAKAGQYKNVVCHCPYCDQDTLMNPSAEDITARNLQCPNCGAPMEIRSELDTYRNGSGRAASVSAPRCRKRRKWIVPLVIVLILAVLTAIGSRELKKQEAREETPPEEQTAAQAESFRITEEEPASGTDPFGDTLFLAVSGNNGYTVSSTSADKTLVWDPDAESYYDESSGCWIWYNTDVEPPVWQYWYEGISSDYGDYGWMEHDADGWFIEESFARWIPVPDTYDTERLWFIAEDSIP